MFRRILFLNWAILGLVCSFNNNILYPGKFKILHLNGIRRGKENAIATELTPINDDLLLLDENAIETGCHSKVCYFDKRSPCPYNLATGELFRCPIDDRFCGANRDYFDHVYGGPSINDHNILIKEGNSDEYDKNENNFNMLLDYGKAVNTKRITRSRSQQKGSSLQKSSSSSSPLNKRQSSMGLLTKKERKMRRKKVIIVNISLYQITTENS